MCHHFIYKEIRSPSDRYCTTLKFILKQDSGTGEKVIFSWPWIKKRERKWLTFTPPPCKKRYRGNKMPLGLDTRHFLRISFSLELRTPRSRPSCILFVGTFKLLAITFKRLLIDQSYSKGIMFELYMMLKEQTIDNEDL